MSLRDRLLRWLGLGPIDHTLRTRETDPLASPPPRIRNWGDAVSQTNEELRRDEGGMGWDDDD